jgi:DNA-directed RNA polymerase specialized sigma24 family protein
MRLTQAQLEQLRKDGKWDIILSDLECVWNDYIWEYIKHTPYAHGYIDDLLQSAKLKVWALIKNRHVVWSDNWRSFLITVGLNTIKNILIRLEKERKLENEKEFTEEDNDD